MRSGMLRDSHYARKVADCTTAALSYWDVNRVCRYANRAYRERFGRPGPDMVGRITIRELLGSQYPKALPFIEKAYAGIAQEFERDITAPQGNVCRTLTTYTPDIENGEVKGVISQVVDVTYLKDVEEKLRAAKEKAENFATHDFLTGLPNRTLLNDRVGSAIAVANRKRCHVAVCVMDMDGFKEINDRCGHQTGDTVLKEMARRVSDALREYDSVARVGGDEFVILLTEVVNREQVRTVLERIVRASAVPFEMSGHVISATLSIGVAIYPEDGRNITELIRSADRALYDSKERGKNCYSFYGPQGDATNR